MPENKSSTVFLTAEASYAGFLRRAGAFILDVSILCIPLYLLSLAFSNSFDRTLINQEPPSMEFFHLIRVFIGWQYFTLFECSRWRATPGKAAFRIFIADKNGVALTFSQSSVRYFAKIISVTVFGAGCFWALFNKRNQAFHDVAASTLVLRKQ